MAYSVNMPMIASFGASDPLAAGMAATGQNNAAAVPALGANPAAASGSVGSGLGFNIGTGQLLLGGLQTIGSLWNSFEARKLAKEQLAFQKDVTNTNLNNQIKSYNTTLEDRSRSRAFTEGQSAETAQAYIDKNRLSR